MSGGEAETAACELCPHRCRIRPGTSGFCQARGNVGGRVVCLNHGQATALALDPVEKKPFARFYPGASVLSYGSWGCNLRCPFCQNSSISIDFEAARARAVEVSPERLVAQAEALRPRGCVGVAFTYNEPTLSYEYVLEATSLAHEAGLVSVLVTNGYVNEGPWTRLMEAVDAVNVDLKAMTQRFYDGLGAPGGLARVKRSIEVAARLTHVEVSYLVVPAGPGARDGAAEALPGNDSAEEVGQAAAFLASVDPDITLHLLAFRPRWRLAGRRPTSRERVAELARVAWRSLHHICW